MIVAGGCGVQPTDKHHHLHRHRTRTTDDDGRAYIYIILMQCDVNSMHNSSRHQQFKLPSPAGVAEQALGGASDD